MNVFSNPSTYEGWYKPYCPLSSNNKAVLEDIWLRPDRKDAATVYLGPKDKEWYTPDEYFRLYDDKGELKIQND